MATHSPPLRRRRALRVVAALFSLASLVGCSTTASTGSKPGLAGPSAGDVPTLVSVAGADVAVGFERGHLRGGATVAAFRLTRHPVTVAQYRACVAKGACSEPAMRTLSCIGGGTHDVLDRATYGIAGGDALPITCTTVDQAAQYCAWIGGALPTMEQWMLAARGPQVARYAWGNDAPTCEQRVVTDGECAPYVIPGTMASADVLASFAVGQHPKGAAPTGVEDVLLAPAELLAISPAAFFGACAPPNAACRVDRAAPASIDAVEALATRGVSDDPNLTTSTFRCALPEVPR